MPVEHPARRKLHRADQARLVGMMDDRTELEGRLFGQDRRRAADRELPHVARAEAAADHDALGLHPGRQAQELADDGRELRAERFDRVLDQAGSQRILAKENLVELGLGHLASGPFAKRVLVTLLLELGAALVDDLAEGLAAGAIADEAFGLAQLFIVAVYRDSGQSLCSVGKYRGWYAWGNA